MMIFNIILLGLYYLRTYFDIFEKVFKVRFSRFSKFLFSLALPSFVCLVFKIENK